MTVILLSILFFPGTLIHELSHFIMAQILLVKTGEINLIPRFDGRKVTMGSVTVIGADPFRRILIGVAPFLTGISLILALLFLTQKYHLLNTPWIIVISYSVFEISNSMFSSKKDLEGMMIFIFLISIIVSIYIIFGGQIPFYVLASSISKDMLYLFAQGTYYMAFPIILDLIVIFILRLLLKIM
ncbi:MAG: hypothetical protein QXZ30_03075 [Candidatus Bilamarchaeaceae archaeon]